MQYTSTRDNQVRVSVSQAITQGISTEGGLFVPRSIPAISPPELAAMINMTYTQRAAYVISRFLREEWTPDDVQAAVDGAYASFDSPDITPVTTLDGNTYVLELFRGPTCAFKDIALQLLPRLLTASAKKMGGEQDYLILVATSGDTGKAALEGFRDVPGTRITVFYPSEGVSAMQKRQMTTQEGGNVQVVGIRGNFDDAQTGVKKIFADASIKEKIAARNQVFSSANSINWGRLVPQIVYYFSAYGDLCKAQKIKLGDEIDFVVPTGNFGNILAGFYAKKMGLPIDKLICASNQNRILTDFFCTGIYDRNRDFYQTQSPSMDILISSNLERLLYLATNGDSSAVAAWMTELNAGGKYQITRDLLAKLQQTFACGACDDVRTSDVIAKTWRRHNYLTDPHTAVAFGVLEDYRAETGATTPTVVVSTASPYKFAPAVLAAIDSNNEALQTDDAYGILKALEVFTRIPCPSPLRGLQNKPIRFETVCGVDEMAIWL
ncbi:MAG: threonine synthase [Oscillospiraceae bacterium]|nr:threonine synthase [Oscillospiraceae bacterium]